MVRLFKTLVLLILPAVLVACTTPAPPALGPDGKPLPRVYNISSRDEARIPFTMLDSVNALRQASGAQALRLNSELTAAAATHSRDMAVQNRPWHFGSDGSSPIERVTRAGYPGGMRGELISETFETELETLAAWMEEPASREVILDASAEDMGFAWYQEPNGKLWWTLVTGASSPVTDTALTN
ncbi:MAG: CAP domain-containing protein [Pseudomonadota bacterium]